MPIQWAFPETFRLNFNIYSHRLFELKHFSQDIRDCHHHSRQLFSNSRHMIDYSVVAQRSALMPRPHGT